MKKEKKVSVDELIANAKAEIEEESRNKKANNDDDQQFIERDKHKENNDNLEIGE